MIIDHIKHNRVLISYPLTNSRSQQNHCPCHTFESNQIRNRVDDLNALNINEQQSRLFHFPPMNLIPSVYANLQEINKVMDQALKNHNQKCPPSNKIEKTMVLRMIDNGAIYRCRQRSCHAYVAFVRKGENFQISHNDPQHEHRIKMHAKGRLPKIRNSQVEECFDELQLLNFKPKEIVDFIRSRFKISRAHFYSIKFCRNKRENIRNLLMALSKYDHFFFECKDMRELVAHYKNQKFPDNLAKERDIILLVSRRMKQLYESYHGQYVYFSMFTDIVLETRYTRSLNYQNLGVLYGEDATGSLTLMFGLAIIRKPVRLAFLYVLEKLFKFLGKYPKVIITDYDHALAEAVKRLRDRCKVDGALRQHIQLPYSFLSGNKFQTKVSPQFTSSLGGDLEATLKDSDYKSHQVRLKTIIQCNETFNQYQSRQKISEQLEKYVRGNSILHLQPLFIGLGLTSYSASNLLKSKVLDFFKSPRPMILAVKAFFQIFKIYPILRFLSSDQINARLNPPKESSTKIEKLHLLQMISKTLNSNTKMKFVSKALSEPAALYFYDTLQDCFKGEIDIIQVSNTNYYYRVMETETNYPYTIKKTKETVNGYPVVLWRCDCRVYFKSGLPCWHELKTCFLQGADVSLQVNPYWLVDAKPFLPRPSRPATEHDIKNWPQSDSNHKQFQEQGPQNLSQIVSNAPNEQPKKYFDYSENGNQPQTSSMQGLGEIMDELGVLEWQMTSLPQENLKKEEELYRDGLTQNDQRQNLQRQISEGLTKLEESDILSNRQNTQGDIYSQEFGSMESGKDKFQEEDELQFDNSEFNIDDLKGFSQLKDLQEEIDKQASENFESFEM